MTSLFRGKHLHSTYAPEKEAQRWAAGLKLEPHTAVFLIGDALGFAQQALKDAPFCRFWTLLPLAENRLHRLSLEGQTWAPQDGPLEAFLEKALEDSGVENIRLEVWPAFERAAPELVLNWSTVFRRIFRQFQGSRLTHQRFGASFWKNTLRNLADWEKPFRLQSGSKPILIAASGPSLEKSLDWMKSHRSGFQLWALPSSFEALKTWGLRPDAAVATDGGYYAREHLSCLEEGVPLLSAATGANDPRSQTRPTVFFSQATPAERIFLPLLCQDFLEFPSKGTVAVTAVNMALQMTTGAVIVAGMDLAFEKLRAHAAPHTTESVLRPRSTRLIPWDSHSAQRSLDQGPHVENGIRTSQAMLTYALWLDQENRFSRTVWRLLPSGLTWKSMSALSLDQATSLLTAGKAMSLISIPTLARKERIKKLLNALQHWQELVGQGNIEPSLLSEIAQTSATAERGNWQKWNRAAPDHPETRTAWQAVEKKVQRFFIEMQDFAAGLK